MNFSLDEIFMVIDKVKDTELCLFEYRDADTKIKIRGSGDGERIQGSMPCAGTAGKSTADWGEEAAAEMAEAVPENNRMQEENGILRTLESPMIGTFYTASAENAEPFVRVGDTVTRGQTVGIIEAMKLMNEIKSEWDGTVKEILTENGQMAEYGQPLMVIRTSEE